MLRLSSFFALAGVILVLCNLPPDPDNPSNSAVFLSLKSSTGLENRDIIVDSVGREIEVSVIYFLPGYIKSTSLKIVSTEGVTEFDTILVSVSNGSMDTLRVNKVLQYPGEKKVIASALITDNYFSSDTAQITVLGNLPINQLPSWEVIDTLRVKIQPGTQYMLNLDDTCIDPDGDLLTYVLLNGAPLTDTISNNYYSYDVISADTGSYIVKIVAGDHRNLSDTLIILLTVEDLPAIISDTVGPIIALQLPLKDSTAVSSATSTVQVCCTDANGISNVTCRVGTRTFEVIRAEDSIYSAVIDNLPAEVFTKVTFTAIDSSANQNRDSLTFHIKYDPALADFTPPLITLVSPQQDSVKVSSSSFDMEISCSDESGVGSVVCTVGTRDVVVTRVVGGSFSASITGLTSGANLIKVTARDKTPQENTSSKAVTMIYDPTMDDNVEPSVVLKSPAVNDSRVVSLPLTIQFSCRDDNGIATVTCTQKGTDVTVVNRDDSLYTVTITSLTAGKSDTILFNVTDKSTKKNMKTFTLTVRYNRPPSALTILSPEADGSNVSKTPTFSWTGGKDPDNDTVFYSVTYGTSASAMNAQTDVVTSPSVTLSAVKSLYANTRYFYQVIGWTKEYNDTIRSQIGQFTTIAENGVAYDANGGMGNVPVDDNRYQNFEEVIVKSAGGLSREGYTFGGWNTERDGGGDTYQPNERFKIGAGNVTLYAVWSAISYTVVFNSTGAEVAPNPSKKNVIAPVNMVGTLPSDPQKVTGNIEVYADWDLMDVDGTVYNTITIGSQVWTVENIRTTMYRNREAINFVTVDEAWVDGTYGKYCYYENTYVVDSIKMFGALYNWYAVTDPRNIAPVGWHVPTLNDWNILTNYLIANGYNWDETFSENKIAKSLAGTKGWISKEGLEEGAVANNLSINNRSGFNAFAAGSRDAGILLPGSFLSCGQLGYWWTATEVNAERAHCMFLVYYSAISSIGPEIKANGFYVRLIQD
jgi:uncharacterized protein (TIGR02145 family)/uncharacterized repeat protein (TIGR02543 family)